MAVREEEGVNPDGTRRPSTQEMRQEVARFKANMLNSGATEDQVNEALKDAVDITPPPVLEVATSAGGSATAYTTPGAGDVSAPLPDGKPETATKSSSQSSAKKAAAKK